MNKPTQDSGIPVLTEVLATPPRAVSPAASSPASAPVPPPASTAAVEASNATPLPAFLTARAVETAVEDLADIPVLQVEIETPIEHAPITGWLDTEWTRMEQKISERVLTQLLSRIDTVLEERLQEVLSASLQRATEEIKLGLQQTLGEVVSDAVAQEIENFYFSKK